MKNRFFILAGTFLTLVNVTKAGIREDLEKANQLSDEQWVEKSKLFISAFDELYTGLVNKWREVGGDLGHDKNPFFLYAWKNNKFIQLEFLTYYSNYMDKSQHNPSRCGMHWLRGACCYPCVQCCDDIGIEKDPCFIACIGGTPLCCACLGACCCVDETPVGDDYFTLHIYKPICKQWLFPLLGIEKGNCKKLYAYWMHNFCEPVANLLQKVLKQDFTQFTAEQLDTALNLYRVYYNADNHRIREELCPLPSFNTLPNAFNNKFANLIINSLSITNEKTLQYLSVVLALDSGMTDERLGFTINTLSWYSIDVLSVFKALMAQNAIKTIQVHLAIQDSCEMFLIKGKQKLDEENAYKQGKAAQDGVWGYSNRRIND